MKRENFTDFYIPTIGLDTCSCRYRYQNKLFHFNTWDTSGQERFKFVNSTLHSKAKINCFCFSLNDYSSFERCKENYNDWKKRNANYKVMEYLENHNGCVLILGLKSDLEQKVPSQEIKELLLVEPANCRLYSNRVQYFALSSKNDTFEDLMIPFLYARSITEQPQFFNNY
ncbi:rab family small GTPase [Naegleria gruberi]|uniref:Rab family small GTPase n=1 Tax=Naegleria gruberi TaxID=5762 RepID=D2W209_NAEGR|nr:rab family small GTPase [Naegleria gruberi]EFC36857.1 rab family small GTPase [Naegleria gruberi]|eukprot:XP_002669601.1 rab family small GTPase [Naegleria gruberi strain NEG-M]